MADNPYDVLAPFYDDAGFSQYSAVMADRLLTFLQQGGWMGRRVLDLGCGTGTSIAVFATRSMEVFGLDSSAAMLQVVERRMLGTDYHYSLIHQDMRAGGYPDELDLIFCMGNTLNEVASQRDLETIFQHCYQALNPGKLLVFDLSTIRGLVEHFGDQEHVLDVSDRLLLAIKNTMNYEAVSLQQRLILFSVNAQGWHRDDVFLTMRGYPHTTIIQTLKKVGFTVRGSYDSDLHPFNPQRDPEGRFILVAEKPG